MHHMVTLSGVGVLCDASRQSLETLQTRNCSNSWRISIRRLHFANCMQPPAILNQLPGVNPQGAVILMRMTRRSPSHEGEGGSPKTAISNSSSSMTRWRMGSSRPTSSASEACSGRSRCGPSNKHTSIGFALGYP